jgi:hypothetical protein
MPQTTHAAAPDTALNWPAAQLPQSADADFPVDAVYVPAAQFTHIDAPVPGWY